MESDGQTDGRTKLVVKSLSRLKKVFLSGKTCSNSAYQLVDRLFLMCLLSQELANTTSKIMKLKPVQNALIIAS